MSFLYLLTGCLDLARNPGQKKQRLPQAGKTWRDTTPETALILDIQDEQNMKMGHQILPFLSLPNLWGFGCGEGKERPRIEMGTSQIQWPACDQQQLHLQVTNLKTIEQEYKCGFKNYPKKRKKGSNSMNVVKVTSDECLQGQERRLGISAYAMQLPEFQHIPPQVFSFWVFKLISVQPANDDGKCLHV